MKQLTFMILAAVTLFFTDCKTKSKTTTSTSTSSKESTGTSTSSSTSSYTSTENIPASNATKDEKIQCRVAVSFISFASGIDAAAYDKIEAYVKGHPKQPAFDIIPMGREGERDICMSLKEMNKDEQKAFIKELEKLAKTSDRVKVNENQERTKPK